MDKLIKNKEVGRMPFQKGRFCMKCGNRGIIRRPCSSYQKFYEREMDKYDQEGSLNPDIYEESVLDKCKCDFFYCPCCEKGVDYKGKYPRYNR